MASLLDEGTATMDSRELAEARERLGAGIDIDPSLDRTTVTLSALEPNLAASLDLMADIIKNPAFAPSEIERLRAQQLAGTASELTQPTGIAPRTLPPPDRKSVVSGKSVSVRVDLGGRRISKKKNNRTTDL